jgi:hypothetical protein
LNEHRALIYGHHGIWTLCPHVRLWKSFFPIALYHFQIICI